MFRVLVIAGPPIVFAVALAFAVWYLDNFEHWSLRQWFVDLAEAMERVDGSRRMPKELGLIERLHASQSARIQQSPMGGSVRQFLSDSKPSSPNHVLSTAFSEQQLARMQRVRLMTVSQLTSGLSVSDTSPRYRRVLPASEARSEG